MLLACWTNQSLVTPAFPLKAPRVVCLMQNAYIPSSVCAVYYSSSVAVLKGGFAFLPIYIQKRTHPCTEESAFVGKFCSHIEGPTFVFLHLIPFSKATYAQGSWSGFQFIFIAKLSDIFEKNLFPRQRASQAVPHSYGEHRVKTFSSQCRLGWRSVFIFLGFVCVGSPHGNVEAITRMLNDWFGVSPMGLCGLRESGLFGAEVFLSCDFTLCLFACFQTS